MYIQLMIFLSFNTTLIINIYHSIINITDSFCLVQGIFQPSIPLTHTDAKHNYVSIIQINHIFHQCYLTKQDKCPPRKTTQSVTKKVESRKSRRKKNNLLSAYLWFINRKCPRLHHQYQNWNIWLNGDWIAVNSQERTLKITINIFQASMSCQK